VTAFIRFATGVLAAATAVGSAVAQTAGPPDTALQARLEAVARMRVGREVRVRLDNGAKLGGRFAGASGNMLSVRLPAPGRLPPGAAPPDTAPYEVAVAEMDSMWERRRLGPAGLYLGAGLGAALGFIAANSVSTTEDGDCNSECWETSAGGGVLGGVLGFLAGIVVGFIVPIWDQRFP
jgi:hypothetical protein